MLQVPSGPTDIGGAVRLFSGIGTWALIAFCCAFQPVNAQDTPLAVVEVLATSQNLAQMDGSNASANSAVDMTLAQAIELVLQRNPRLQGHDIDLSILSARRDQANLRPGYELEAELEDIFTTGRPEFLDSWQATIGLGTVLELGQKRDRRVSVINRERERAEVVFQAIQLDAIADAARAYIQALSAQERALLTQRQAENYASWLSRIEGRVQAGVASELEESNARLQVIEARLDRRQAALERQRLVGNLTSYWQGSKGEIGRLFGDVYELPEIPDLGSMQGLVEQNPDLMVFMSDERIRDAEYQLAQSQSAPDVNVSAGVRRLQSDKSMGLVLSASIPLSTGPRNRPYEREAEGRLRRGQVNTAEKRWAMNAALTDLHARLAAAKDVYMTLRERAMPQARTAVSLASDGYEKARYSFQQLSVAQRQLVDIEYAMLNAATDYHLVYLELERLTGQSMAALTSQPR